MRAKAIWVAVALAACAPVWAAAGRQGGTPYRTDAPPSVVGMAAPQPVSKPTPPEMPAPSRGLTAELYAEFEQMAPQDAADLLLRTAKDAGMDLDFVLSRSAAIQSADGKEMPISFLVHTPAAEFEPAPGVEPKLLKGGGTASEGGRQFVMVQLSRYISVRERAQMFSMGLMQHRDAGQLGIIASIPAGSASTFAALPYVRWIGTYKAQYKYDGTPLQYPNLNGTVWSIDPGSESHARDLESLGIRIVNYESATKAYEVEMETSLIPAVAQLPWVYRVEKQPERDLFVADFGVQDSRNIVGSREVLGQGRTGAGVRVGELDTGLASWHPAFAGHIVSGSLTTDTAHNGEAGHGTHTAGTIMGIVNPNPWGVDMRGVAPGALIYMRDFWEGIDMAFNYVYANTERIVNNSWGYGGTYYYTSNGDAEKVDTWVDIWGMMACWSAGNDGYSGVTTPGLAKNTLTSGAISYTRGGDSGGIGATAWYSSRGPTKDGRLKPDLVAPGGDSGDGLPFEYGVVAPDAWSEIHNAYPSASWPYDNYYIRLKGTSMASPHTTGALALMKEWWSGMYTPFDRSIVLANTIPTKDSGSDVLGGYADTDTGYGLLNAWSTNYNYPGEEYATYWVDSVDGANVNKYWYPNVDASTKTLILCMAYNDASGMLDSSNALKNDLDMIAISPSGYYYYAYSHKASGVTKESPVEKLMIPNPEAGTWTIWVRYYSWPSSGSRSQLFTVTLVSRQKTPSLDLYMPSVDTAWLQPSQAFQFQPAVWNAGGHIVAGSSITSGNSAYIGGDVNKTWYLGNLMYQNAQIWPLFNLVAPGSDGNYSLSFTARCVNKDLADNTQYLTVHVDGTPPWNPSTLTPVPALGWTNQTVLAVNWSGEGDATSGVDGFSIGWWYNTPGDPGTYKSLEESDHTTSIDISPYGENDYAFSLRTVDNAGNWTPRYVGIGPWRVDWTAPGGWQDFSPATTADLTPTCTVRVMDARAGLVVSPSSAYYRYSTDGGGHYSGWFGASVTGANGSTAYETITADSVPFNNTGNQNRIQFRIADQAGNLGTSPAYTVDIEAGVLISSPAGFFNPLWNWFSIPYAPAGGADANVVMGVDVTNNLYRWNPISKNLELYPDDFRDLEPGRGYTLRTQSSINVSYSGTPVDPVVYVPEQGVQWIGMPALGTMPQQNVVLYNNTTNEYRTVAHDYASADPWMNTNWVYWDSVNRVAKILNYAGGGDDTLVREWYGYRIWAFHRDLYIIFGQ